MLGSMEDNVFMKIISREVPADILYEDDDTLAFLNNAPNAVGHALVIPKRFAENIFDIDDESLAAVMRTVRKVAPAIRDAVGASGVHVNSNHGAAAGQEVPHFHMHIIPRHDREAFDFCWPKLQHDPIEAKRLAERIREELGA